MLAILLSAWLAYDMPGGFLTNFFVFVLIVTPLLWLYMLPLSISHARDSKSFFIILPALLLIGPTGIGWIALLLWSLGCFDGIFGSLKRQLKDERDAAPR